MKPSETRDESLRKMSRDSLAAMRTYCVKSGTPLACEEHNVVPDDAYLRWKLSLKSVQSGLRTSDLQFEYLLTHAIAKLNSRRGGSRAKS